MRARLFLLGSGERSLNIFKWRWVWLCPSLLHQLHLSLLSKWPKAEFACLLQLKCPAMCRFAILFNLFFLSCRFSRGFICFCSCALLRCFSGASYVHCLVQTIKTVKCLYLWTALSLVASRWKRVWPTDSFAQLCLEYVNWSFYKAML